MCLLPPRLPRLLDQRLELVEVDAAGTDGLDVAVGADDEFGVHLDFAFDHLLAAGEGISDGGEPQLLDRGADGVVVLVKVLVLLML